MTDTFTPECPSWNVSRSHGNCTKLEARLRFLRYRAGFRFRPYNLILPGCPDIVLSKYHSAVFVDGCYSHRHEGCVLAAMPKTRTRFWQAITDESGHRGQRKADEQTRLDWQFITVWERELDNIPEQMLQTIRKQFMEGSNGS